MRSIFIVALLLVVVTIGCGHKPVTTLGIKQAITAEDVERVVREKIAELMAVDAATISMDRPLSDPPLKADALDCVELVMELEERFEIVIPDASIERYTGADIKLFAKITPNQLALIVLAELKAQRPKQTR